MTDEQLAEYGVTLYKLMEQGKYEEGLSLVESRFDKSKSSDWYTKGNFLKNLSRLDESLECYNEAIRLDNRYVKAWYRKGSILFILKKYLESTVCYDKVIDLEQENNSKSNSSKDWSNASAFSCMIAYVLLAKQYELAKNPVPQQILQKETYWVNTVKPFLEQSKTTPEFDGDGFDNLKQFLDYCIREFHNILKQLESNVVFGLKIE